jgi:hypothetical protein
MPSFAVADGHNVCFKDAAISVDQYEVNDRNTGVNIKISHNVPKAADTSLLWVQTVAENGSFKDACKKSAYVDPAGFSDATGKIVCKPDDDLPFYYTDLERGGQKDDPDFDDGPSEAPPKKGGTWIRFITSLTEVTGGTDVLLLASIVWGFDIYANGKLNLYPLRRAQAFEQKGHSIILKHEFPAYTFHIGK